MEKSAHSVSTPPQRKNLSIRDIGTPNHFIAKTKYCLIIFSVTISMTKYYFQGRKSRRDRQAWKESQIVGPHLPVPPTYAQKESPAHEEEEEDRYMYICVRIRRNFPESADSKQQPTI